MAKAHGGPIDITGITVASVDDKVRLQKLNTYYDPLEMFRQIAPHGIVNKSTMNRNVTKEAALEDGVGGATKAESAAPSVSTIQTDGVTIGDQHNSTQGEHHSEPAPNDVLPKHMSTTTGEAADAFVPHQGSQRDEPGGASKDSEIERAQTVMEEAAKHSANSVTSKTEQSTVDATTGVQGGPVAANSSAVNGREGDRMDTAQQHDESKATGTSDAIDAHLESSASLPV